MTEREREIDNYPVSIQSVIGVAFSGFGEHEFAGGGGGSNVANEFVDAFQRLFGAFATQSLQPSFG